MPPLTHDPFLNGNIILKQPQNGYRFSIDAVVLAHRVRPLGTETILDLGTGCGVIPLILAFRHATVRLVGVEIQAELADLARQNVAANGLADRIHIVTGDMRRLTPAGVGGPVDMVVANPPYRKLTSGRINAHTQRAVARHELTVDLEQVLQSARRMLKPLGRFFVIYPCVRAVDLIAGLRSTGLEPKTMMTIHSGESLPARLVTVMGVKGGRPGLEIDPPLVLYNRNGSYTKSVQAMLAG